MSRKKKKKKPSYRPVDELVYKKAKVLEVGDRVTHPNWGPAEIVKLWVLPGIHKILEAKATIKTDSGFIKDVSAKKLSIIRHIEVPAD